MNATYRFVFMSSSGAQLKKLAGLYESSSITPVIDKTYDFGDSIRALEYLSNGRAKGKIIVKIVTCTPQAEDTWTANDNP